MSLEAAASCVRPSTRPGCVSGTPGRAPELAANARFSETVQPVPPVPSVAQGVCAVGSTRLTRSPLTYVARVEGLTRWRSVRTCLCWLPTKAPHRLQQEPE